MRIEEEFERVVGAPLGQVLDLYKQAVANDWRTVQTSTQQVLNRFSAHIENGADAARQLDLTRAILKSEPVAVNIYGER
jgi:hypothetical protein